MSGSLPKCYLLKRRKDCEAEPVHCEWVKSYCRKRTQQAQAAQANPVVASPNKQDKEKENNIGNGNLLAQLAGLKINAKVKSPKRSPPKIPSPKIPSPKRSPPKITSPKRSPPKPKRSPTQKEKESAAHLAKLLARLNVGIKEKPQTKPQAGQPQPKAEQNINMQTILAIYEIGRTRDKGLLDRIVEMDMKVKDVTKLKNITEVAKKVYPDDGPVNLEAASAFIDAQDAASTFVSSPIIRARIESILDECYGASVSGAFMHYEDALLRSLAEMLHEGHAREAVLMAWFWNGYRVTRVVNMVVLMGSPNTKRSMETGSPYGPGYIAPVYEFQTDAVIRGEERHMDDPKVDLPINDFIDIIGMSFLDKRVIPASQPWVPCRIARCIRSDLKRKSADTEQRWLERMVPAFPWLTLKDQVYRIKAFCNAQARSGTRGTAAKKWFGVALLSLADASVAELTKNKARNQHRLKNIAYEKKGSRTLLYGTTDSKHIVHDPKIVKDINDHVYHIFKEDVEDIKQLEAVLGKINNPTIASTFKDIQKLYRSAI